ncbi:UbiA family prenyltransferase [Candidatus Albibeggiatoa sp. nov. NOAA]|uniref:UbiA family prenyltransferase n=1 Tax=Candidatus Albibeggiatoa sp. nov. NOAA TaxID=3162724 RepID=UPI00330009E9|nr:UbiA family prenyltransferase [Thiotrichaceae bacterium]
MTQLLSGIKPVGENKMGNKLHIDGDVNGSSINVGGNGVKQVVNGIEAQSDIDDEKISTNTSVKVNKLATKITVGIFSVLGLLLVFYLGFMSAPLTCTYSIWLKDRSTLKTITNAKTIFNYQNDNYVFYPDSEGFYKGSLECDKNEGRIHVEAKGYQVYERNFRLDNTMQEIRLIPE